MSKKSPHPKKSIPQPKERYTLKNTLANAYLFVMFTLFPLFINLTVEKSFPFITFANGYRAIRHQKYYFFMIITAAALIVQIMLLLTKTAAERKAANPEKRRLTNLLSFTDWAVLAFVLSCAVSTVFSPYLEMALTGESAFGGRNNGLLLMLTYAAIYFMLTRCYRYREYVFLAMAIVNGLICLLAVLNGFYHDPLGMLEPFRTGTTEADIRVYENFMTTIGNKNMFSSHLCVTLPVLITLFVHTKKWWCKAVYLASAAVGAMAVIVCDSDSVVLGLGAFVAVYLVVYVRRLDRLRQFLLALTVMLLSVKLLRWFSYLGGDRYKDLTALPCKLMFSNKTFLLIGALAVLTAALYAVSLRFPKRVLPKAVPVVLASLMGAAVLAGVGVIVYFTAFDTKTDLGSWERLLRYGDAWGTHRGFMWNRSLEAFKDYNFFQKLFGTGPETFYYTFSPYFGELYERFGDGSTDAAHNEYINYLMNIGIVGLLSYLAFTGSALVRGFRAAKHNPIALVFASAVVAYMAQAVVNISVPIAAPLCIIFVSLCEATARQTPKTLAPPETKPV